VDSKMETLPPSCWNSTVWALDAAKKRRRYDSGGPCVVLSRRWQPSEYV
jgi:hypothetical protein